MSMSKLMSDHHKHCDEIFVQCEQAVSEKNWEIADQLFYEFEAELLDHIDNKEESILFPEVEKQLGPIGPIIVMKQEHQQMRQLTKQLKEELANKDSSNFLNIAESLLILIQQHNMKEEQILYPLIQQHLNNTDDLIR